MLRCKVWKKGAYFSIRGTRSGRCPFQRMKASVVLNGEVKMGSETGVDVEDSCMVSQKTIMKTEVREDRRRMGLRHFWQLSGLCSTLWLDLGERGGTYGS